MSLETRLREELDQLAARVPAAPGDLDGVHRRARRLTWRRRAVLVGGAAAMVAAVAVGVAVFQPFTRPVPPPFIGEGEELTEPPQASERNSAPDPLPAEDLGVPLLSFGERPGEGLVRITAEGRDLLWAEPVAAAFPLPHGGVVFQPAPDPLGPASGQPIYVAPVGLEASVLIQRQVERIHGVRQAGGEVDVLVTIREGEGDEGEERQTLYAAPLPDPGAARVLAVTGAYESGIEEVVFDGDQVAWSSCHLQCSVYLSSDAAHIGTDTGTAVVDPPDWVEGLDLAGDTLGFVRLQFQSEIGELADPHLVLAGTDQERNVPIPFDRHVRDAVVDLSPDAASALVSLQDPEFRWTAFHVALAPATPVVRQVEAPGALRFDTADAHDS